MLKNHSKSKSGFTIIEVVLVLAIAGLIFLMVFLALPALQRSQRDTQRRDDLSGFSTQITNYQSNNRGKVPTDDAKWKKFFTDYMKQADDSGKAAYGENGGEFVDPDGSAYLFSLCTGSNFSSLSCNGLKYDTASKAYTISADNFIDNEHTIRIVPGGKCDGESIVEATGGSSRQLAFVYKMEGGGVYCGSNS